MSVPNYLQDKTEQSSATQTPSVNNRWRFADLSAADLLPQLQRHLFAFDAEANWQLVWLNNDGRPVIGLLPKVSWSVYFDNDNLSKDTSTFTQTYNDKPARYNIVKYCRENHSLITTKMSYAEWQDTLIDYSSLYNNNDKTQDSASFENVKEEKSSYHHGLIGFIGYDVAAHELSSASTIKQSSQQESQPCAVLGHYDIYLTPMTSDNNGNTDWQLTVQTQDKNLNSCSKNKTLTMLVSSLNKLDKQLANKDSLYKPAYSPSPLMLTAQWHKSAYKQAFAQVQRYLQQGDCYQINLTQVWQSHLSKSGNNNKPMLIDYLPALHKNTNAPFAGYLSVKDIEIDGAKNINFELLSCSPELFFTFIKDKKTEQNYIYTKPIKGTVPRGNNAEQDLLLKQQLINSDKDRSENVMIVDLLRNDLGKYAKTGSVKVPQLFAIESFSNVHHMVSTITAELKPETHPLAVLFGSLPAGSITGTPKKRAVEIISELEAAPRGAYCGTMGFMNFDGSGQWNVLIRTLQSGYNSLGEKQVSLWAGGGITIASDCGAEYQECLDKVGNLLTVLAKTAAIT